jgi:hypothetical protein
MPSSPSRDALDVLHPACRPRPPPEPEKSPPTRPVPRRQRRPAARHRPVHGHRPVAGRHLLRPAATASRLAMPVPACGWRHSPCSGCPTRHARRCWPTLAAPGSACCWAGYVVNRLVTRLLRARNWLATCLGAVAAATDDDHRLVRRRHPLYLLQPGRRVRAALLVEEGQQPAARHDSGFLPLAGGADVDDRHPGGEQPCQFGIVDIDHLGADR